MPALGIDPRTGQLIVLPGGGSSGSWGPSQQAADRQRQEIYTGRTIEEWQREDINWIRRLVEGYWDARERARREAQEQLAISLALQNPYTAMAFAETGISPKLALENPAAFSAVAMAAFKKYQDDVKKAWQEGKGPIRPLTAEEFVQDLLSRVGWGYETYIGLTGDFEVWPFTPTHLIQAGFDPDIARDLSAKTAASFLKIPVNWEGSASDGAMSLWRGPGAYALLDLVEPAYLPQWLLTAKRFFSWATNDAWWLNDPDYLARNPDAARGYGKVSEAPPGWEKVGDNVYQDPTTGFLYFSDTGAYLGHGFLGTWRQNSGLLGTPVTNEFSKNGKVYQVFENGVLSWDPSTREIRIYKSLDEAGLSTEDVVRSSPSYWTSSGKEISKEYISTEGAKKTRTEEAKKTWTEDPYLGKGSSYYDSNPAKQRLPESAPSSYPYYDIPGSSVRVSDKAVWIIRPNGQFEEPDYWIRSRFMSQIRTNPELRNWYYSLSDRDKNQVFANYIVTGQIYL